VLLSSISQAASLNTLQASVVVVDSVLVEAVGPVVTSVEGPTVGVGVGLGVVGVSKQSSTSAPVAGPQTHPLQFSNVWQLLSSQQKL